MKFIPSVDQDITARASQYFENKCNFLLISLQYTFSTFPLFKVDNKLRKQKKLVLFGFLKTERDLAKISQLVASLPEQIWNNLFADL